MPITHFEKARRQEWEKCVFSHNILGLGSGRTISRTTGMVALKELFALEHQNYDGEMGISDLVAATNPFNRKTEPGISLEPSRLAMVLVFDVTGLRLRERRKLTISSH